MGLCLLLGLPALGQAAGGAGGAGKGDAEPVWQEDFADGLTEAGARPYYKDQPQTTLEVVADGASEGGHHLRATLPGERPLEGAILEAEGLSGDRLVTVTARVRGRGEMMLCLRSGNGWMYPRPYTTLSDQWQTVTVSKALGPGDQRMGIYFISAQKRQPGAVFEVDDVRVREAAAMTLHDAAVPPGRFEAEDFLSHPGMIGEGGTAAQHDKQVTLLGVPFPRTSRPVTVSLRVRPGGASDRFSLVTYRPGGQQTIRSMSASAQSTSSEGWQWLSFEAVSAEEAGDSLRIDAKASGDGPVAIDAVVLSTQVALSSEALAAATPLSPAQGPLARVSRIEQASPPPEAAAGPVIDGRADDPAWAHTVAIADFLTYQTFTPVSAGATARLAYDDENLYVLMVLDEPVLSVAAQRRHEIVAKVTDRDGKVLRDDAVMVLLQPTEEGPAYEFSVNTLGTLLDARCDPADLWGTRDPAWNSNARVAATTEDGYWTVEMAIPLKDLGVDAPTEGDRWQAVLARVAQARSETSSWNPSARGAHDPAAMGTLVFGGAAVGVEPTSPLQRLEPGINTIGVGLTPAASDRGGVYLSTAVRFGDAAAQRAVSFAPATDAASVAHAFEVAQSGTARASWAARDAATLEPLYVSPEIHAAVQESSATLTLTTAGAYELWVNNRVVARGSEAQAATLQIPLREGANVLALQVESGAAALTLDAPGEDRTPIRWRIAPKATADATSAELDDRAWAIASSDGTLIGTPGDPAVLRHTLLWHHTQVWPAPRPALHIAGNSVQTMNFTAFGLSGKQMLDWSVYLAVPEPFEVLGSTGYYGDYVETQAKFTTEPMGEVEIDGEMMPLYRVSASKPLRPGRHQVMSIFQLLVRIADAAEAAPGSAWTVHYWSEANGGTMSEPAQAFEVRVLPALAGRQPEKFVMQFWGGAFHVMDNQELRRPVLETTQAAGFNEFVTSNRWVSDVGPEYGLATQLLVNFKPWSIGMGPHLEDHPDQRLIDREGKARDDLICTTVLLDGGWSAAEPILAKLIEERRPAVVQYDYEQPPFTGPHVCYCDRCLGHFRRRAGLSQDTTLSPQEIQQRHAAAWIDFMAYRAAKLFKLMKDSTHRIAPGTLFSVYSGYHTPDNAARYGVDWEYVGQMHAADIIGCGYGRPVEAIDTTLRAIGDIPALFGVLLRPYSPTDMKPVTPATKAIVLRRALDATGGVLVYDARSMDGRSWLAVAETSRLIAEHEGLFLHSELAPIPGQDPARVQVIQDEAAALVCIINDGREPADFSFDLPEALGGGQEFYSGRQVAAGEAIKLTLPPGETAVYVLRR